MPIPELKHHIVFVSSQALPTLLGLFCFKPEPTHIHAVITPAMQEAAMLLKNMLKSRCQKCNFISYELADNIRQESIYQVLDDIKAACPESSLGLNLTGGTKLMALAAWEWAYAHNIPAFYIDTAQDLIIHTGDKWQYEPLPDVLTVKDLLLANGFEIKAKQTGSVPEKRRQILVKLLKLACTKEGEKALGRLNHLAKTCLPDLYIRDDSPPNDLWIQLISICEEAGMAKLEDGILSFPNEDCRRWCNGAWIEEYIQMTLYRLKHDQKIKDWAINVQVDSQNEVPNELDALFCIRNRLFIVESKTSTMMGSINQSDKVPSYLYKADSLHDRLGGIYAKAMLCSVRRLKNKDLNRAQNMGVKVIFGKDILNLYDIIVDWIKTA
ncbi:MAG: DUF1887 family protein [Desulfovibrionaceae bacterium]|nr:DUF1887 family protein [Desulfovibrionaceae bacterium]